MERLVGKKAPNFTMTAVTGVGDNFFQVSLADYKDKWLVLFFYPLDFTFVCPTEITGFDGKYEEFQKCGADILAVSTDSQYAHQAWIRDGLGKIRFPMAADKTLSVSADYGVLLEEEGVALRGLFIIDPEQTIKYSVIHDLNIGRNTEETLRVLRGLQTGGLCGANWKEGQGNLKPEDHKAGSEQLRSEAEVLIYTMPDCSYCKKVKSFFQEKSIPYMEIDLQVDTPGQKFMEERGYTALPVTVIGNTEISGYHMEKIREALTP